MGVVDIDLGHWLTLALTPGIGPRTARTLLSAFGSPEAVVTASRASLERAIPSRAAAAVLAGPRSGAVETAVAWAAEEGNHILTLADEAYPQSLLETADPPILLYAKGRTTLLSRAGVAIVGSRHATPQGVNTTRAFARALGDAGLTIISGLALGIDTAAHEGGLDSPASTIAVTGTGLDIVYPARNRALAHRIAAKGLLVSEFPLGTAAIAHNFPRRNRLISGLSRGVLVMEAALRSGSLGTARFATEQGREVFAVPGSIHSPVSKGCHALIKQGAKLVESAGDVLEELNLSAASSPASAGIDGAEPDPLLELLGHDPCDLDALASRSGLGADELAVRLLELELMGLVASLPGARFQRT